MILQINTFIIYEETALEHIHAAGMLPTKTKYIHNINKINSNNAYTVIINKYTCTSNITIQICIKMETKIEHVYEYMI